MATDVLQRILTESYAHEVEMLDGYAEHANARLERELRQLVRSDGSPVYAPAEMQEREQAIRAAVVAEYDRMCTALIARGEQHAAEAERKMALLDREPIDMLSAEGQARAAARREFIREDVERLGGTVLADRINAAIAAGDKPLLVLYERYGQERSDRTQEPLRSALVALRTALGLDERAGKVREMETKIRAAKLLQQYPSRVRRDLDGSNARMRQQMAGAYGRF
jgi:hypothetical protein